jgi:hypothetical protein
MNKFIVNVVSGLFELNRVFNEVNALAISQDRKFHLTLEDIDEHVMALQF